MTVNTIGSVAEFVTNGVTTNFPFYFKFLANEDLVVTYVNPLGVSSILTLGTHYTANGAGNDQGGSVVTTSALAGPGQLIVSREMEAFQQTSLRNQGKFLAETHEDVFDKLTMLIQQGLSIFARALKRPFGRDYFFAENRRITAVKDPVDDQDAATKHSVQAYVSSILETGQGPINNAANVLYVYPDGTSRTVQSLAVKNSDILGSAGIGHRNRTVQQVLDNVIFASSIGPFGTAAETTATIAAARAIAIDQGKELWLIGGQGGGIGGRYDWNGVNLPASNLTIRAVGGVELHNVSAGPALTLDQGMIGHCINFKFLGDPLISGTALSTDGVFIRALQHSNLELRVKDVPGTAFIINFGVCTRYKLTCSVNQQPFSIVPAAGILVTGRTVDEFTSACEFDTPIIEGVSGTGIRLIDCQSSRFLGGTSEHNGGAGVDTSPGSKYNIFDSIDLEQNGGNDIQLRGIDNEFRNIVCRSVATTNNIEVIDAVGARFVGGDLRCANIQSSSSGTHFEGSRFSNNGSLGIKGTGRHTRRGCTRYDTDGNVTARYSDILGNKGTFTPLLQGATTAGSNTYSVQTGTYSVVGDRVVGDIVLTLTAKDAAMAGTVIISGFPYPASATSGGCIGLHGGVATPTAGYVGLAWRILAGQAAITLLASGFDKVLSALSSSSVSSTTTITLSFSYPIASEI